MIKKILIYIVIVFSIFLFVDSVNAQVSINGSNLTYNNFAVISEGNRILNFNQEKVYSDSSVFPKNFLITMCADNQQVSAWYVNNNSLTTVNVYTTNYSCTFPNSTYTGGHIVYVYGELNGLQACSVDGRNCIINGSLTMYVPNQSSWSILNEQYSLDPISIDYASGSIISNDQTIINQNSQIIAGQNNIYDKQVETNNKLDDIKDMDISEEDKELPDDTEFNNYQDAEDDLMEKVEDADMSVLDVAIDVDSSNFVWETLTDFIQSHTLIFGTVIAILSIGIIKLALGR